MTEDPRTERLRKESVARLLWSFSLPAIAAMIMGSIYTVIDRAFLGMVVGPDALAGISLCMPVGFVMAAFGMLIGLGSGALVSIRLGQKDKPGAEAILGNAFTMILVVSVVLPAVLLALLDPLLLTFGASVHTLPYAKQFLHVILVGAFFQYSSLALNAVIRGEGNPRIAMVAMLINAGLNIALDVVLVLWLRFGVTGAAVATVLSQAVSAIFTLAHFRSSRSVLRLRFRGLRPRWEIVRPVLAIGVAPFAMQVSGSVVSLLVNRGLARHGGDSAVAAYGVIGALAMLMLMPVFGLNQGAQPIIGYNYGAGQMSRVRAALKLGIAAATVVVCVGFTLSETVPSVLMRAFVPDQHIVDLGARGMRIAMIMLPVVGFQIVCSSFFQAIGKAKIALVLSLLRQVIILIPLLVILPPLFGLDGVWVAGPIADAVASLITGVAIASELRGMQAGAETATPASAAT